MSTALNSTVVPANPGPPTVLVVDDEVENCEVLNLLLTAQGFRVVTAEDGAAALEAVAASPPDAILLDVMMPVLDGFETCRRLKTQPSTVFIPIILITALHSTKDRTRGAAAGADDFITKPFDGVELTTRLKSLLRLKSLHDQLEHQNRDLERRVAERTLDLQQALAELQELDRLKSQFISNVSHELRTPLMHAKTCVQLLADEALGTLTSDQLKSMQVAQTAIGELENIVADILDFSGSPGRALTLSAVALPGICRAAMEELAPFAARQHVAVRLALPPEMPLVLANRPALTRMLRHLLDNAVKFSPPESTVFISADVQPPQVRLSIQDFGSGIAPPQVGHIFDAFYQVDGAATRRANGLGIGLAVVKKLAEAQGIQIGVESQVDKGSRFYFDLQVAPQTRG